MTPSQAQAAFVAADERFLAHARECYSCGNPRRGRYSGPRRYCDVGRSLHLTALAQREVWASAVAEMRAAAATANIPERRGTS